MLSLPISAGKITGFKMVDESPSTTDDDSAAAKSVAADIASFGKSRELSDDEFIQRLAVSQAAEKRRLRYEQECRAQHQKELAEAEAKAAADAARQARQAAIADAEARQRASREAMERSNRSRETAGIFERLNRAEQFRNRVVAEARRNAVVQQRQSMIADLEKDIAALNPPPPPEPTIVIEQQTEGSDELGTRNFDASLWKRGRGSWW